MQTTRRELQGLLRLIIEHKSDYLIFIESGKLRGLINRGDLIASLSNVHEESKELPLRRLSNVSEALGALEFDNAGTSDNPLLPVVNARLEYVGLWGRTEILQAWENVPRISVWSPPAADAVPAKAETTRVATPTTLPEPEPAEASQYKRPKIAVYTVTGKATRQEDAEPETPAAGTPDAEVVTIPDSNAEIAAKIDETAIEHGSKQIRRNPIFQKIQPVIPARKIESETQHSALPDISEPTERPLSPEGLAIATIEALAVPLMACDLNGHELFHNEDWTKASAQAVVSLEAEKLFRTARQKMTQTLMHPAHIPGEPILFDDLIPGRIIKMRPIKTRAGNTDKTAGYLFWIEDRKTATGPVAHSAEKSFKGQTLPDIVDAEEKKALLWAMEQTGNNQSDAAMILGIPRQTFSYKYRKFFKGQT